MWSKLNVLLSDPRTRDIADAFNGCDRLVTTDPHFLHRRSALEASCRGLRIVKPSELAAELAATA